MGIVNWRQVAQNRNEWRRTATEVFIFLGQWSHRRRRRRSRIIIRTTTTYIAYEGD
jgi:hypothetical protein